MLGVGDIPSEVANKVFAFVPTLTLIKLNLIRYFWLLRY